MDLGHKSNTPNLHPSMQRVVLLLDVGGGVRTAGFPCRALWCFYLLDIPLIVADEQWQTGPSSRGEITHQHRR